MRFRNAGLFVLALVSVLSACTATASPDPDPSASATVSTPPTPSPVVDLTVGVYGRPREIEAFTRATGRFNQSQDAAVATVQEYPNSDALIEAMTTAQPLPDVFLIEGQDLELVMQHNANQPVERLLDERGVRFGDDYKRDAVLAFSANARLQCMPFHASPTVMYINADLVDLTRLDEVEVPPPTRPYSWNLEQFSAALELGVRPRRGTYGVWVDPTLEGVLPFLLGLGATPYDDAREPTRFNLANPDLRDSLESVLSVLRTPRLTIPSREKRSPIELFKAGRLMAISGDRDLVPALRNVEGLNFDVMPLPTNARAATTATFRALCLSRETESVAQAADLLTALNTPVSIGDVTRQGYLVPANTLVSESEAFIQPFSAPAGAVTFNATMRAVQLPPRGVDWQALAEATDPLIEELLTVEVLDLDEILPRFDEASRAGFVQPDS